MKRLSSYVICVELQNTDKCLLVHGYTGAIDIIDNKIVQYLKKNRHSFYEVEFPFFHQTWKNLEKRGYITPKTQEQEITYVQRMANLLHRYNKKAQKYFGFAVSYNCNFRCPYCYEARVSDFGKGWTKKTFAKKTVDEAYNAMLLIEPHKHLHIKNLLLYGGEPLLKENKEIVTYVVNKGTELGYKFSTVTNGYDLDSFMDLLAPNKIASLQITIDGSKRTHNKTRIHKNGRSSFEQIIKNIGQALQQEVKIRIRMNCNEENITEIAELKSIFEQEGFYNYKGFYFYSALIYDYLREHKGKDMLANDLKFMGREDFINCYKEDSEHNYEDEGITDKIASAIKNGRQIPLIPTYCAAFSHSYLFDPYRNIYSCWEVLGKPDSIVGKYNESDVSFNGNLDKLHAFNIGKSKKCNKCKYVFICRGGCPVRKNKHLCSLMPKLFEISANKAYNASLASVL